MLSAFGIQREKCGDSAHGGATRGAYKSGGNVFKVKAYGGKGKYKRAQRKEKHV